MYDFEWHKAHGDQTTSSAKFVTEEFLRIFKVDSVLDVGCGDGRWLRAFKDLGVSKVFGVDGPWTDRSRLLIDADEFRVVNLEQPLELAGKFDLVMTTEVAEHLERRYADQFVAHATDHADLVLFGAAIPFQGGFRHVNEEWQSYWAEKFERVGFACFDLFRAKLWDRADISFWYKQNMLVYIRASRADLVDAARRYADEQKIAPLPLNVVHPELYGSLASYKQIAFKPLLRELPGRVAHKAAALLSRKT